MVFALAFALMSQTAVVKTVQHLTKGFGEQIVKNPLFGAVSADFMKALYSFMQMS